MFFKLEERLVNEEELRHSTVLASDHYGVIATFSHLKVVINVLIQY